MEASKLESAGFVPGSARVIVTLSVGVEVGNWPADCLVGDAAATAIREAKDKLAQHLEGSGIIINGATFARVVYDAKQANR